MTAIATPRGAGSFGTLARVTGRAATRAAVVVLFACSAQFLTHVGYHYMSSGGTMLTKIHPATYLATLAALLMMASEGLPRAIASTAIRHPGFVAHGFGMVLLAYSCIVIQRYPPSQIIDTFVSGMMLFLALTRITARDRTWFVGFIHVFMTANAAIGLVEMLTPFRLMPTYFGDIIVTFEWRSTAMLGHPLSNAALTGVYTLLLTGPAGRAFPLPLRLALIGLQIAAMMSFGGRAAAVLLGLFLAVQLAIGWARLLTGARFDRKTALLAAAFLVGGLLASLVVYDLGVLDRFIARFIDDNGSASTRTAMLHVFDNIDPFYFLFGPEPWLIANAQRRLGTAIAIESFVVGFVALYGLFVTVVFFAGLALFLTEVLRASSRAAAVPLAYYMIVAAGSNSISAKSTDLTITIVMCLVLLRADRIDGGQAPASSASRMRAISQASAGSPLLARRPSAANSNPGMSSGGS